MESSVRKRASISIEQRVVFIEESMKPGYSQIQASKKHLIQQSTLAGSLIFHGLHDNFD